MPIPGLSRRWLIAAAVSLMVALLATIGVAVVYPRVGARMVRSKVAAKLGAKLGRDVTVAGVDVALGHAVLRGIEVRGPNDRGMPLVHVDRVEVAFDGWKSLIGTVVLGEVKVDGVLVTVHRDADGKDNVQDVIDRLRGGGEGSSGGASSTPKPTSIAVTRVKLQANDNVTGATALVADGEAQWTPEGITAEVRGVTATTLNAPRASAAKIRVEKVHGATPIVSVEGGEVALWPKLALSGIAGKIVANPKQPSDYIIDLAGGYGGVPGRLWTARGDLDPRTLTASLDLEAAKFQLDRLAPLLEHSAVVDYATTAIDTKVHLEVDRDGAKFSGNLHLSGLNVGHPMIAEHEVHDLDLSAQVAGSFERATRKLELTRGDFVVRNLPFSITGVVIAPPRPVLAAAAPATTPVVAEAPRIEGGKAARKGRKSRDKAALDVATDKAMAAITGADKIAGLDKNGPRIGPHGIQVLNLHFVIPPVECQRVLDAIPVEMAPYMAGYKAKGTFDSDVHINIDWSDLDATQLDGHVALKKCRITDEPADSPKRLKDEFEHSVEVDQGEWISFDVGPTNEEFVPFDQISPYLVKSIMSTEDSAFYQHHGFIPSEFRTALINNLKAGRFVQGASSITMQMVKNVLLYREKTLARKLQELFLTWHVENTLAKDRILEIYLNVIEYGPGLYGIGPAAWEYFGKKPKDLTPTEAAFFSTILPSPKQRYAQYCNGTLTKWTTGKIDRILQIMLKRDRLTQAEYDAAIETPLLFSKDGMESEDACMARVKKAIKNARPTNPLAEKKIAAERAKADSKDSKRDRHERRESRRHADDRPPI